MASAAAADPTLDWTRQIGSTASDSGTAVSADGLGSVYVAGFTYGDLAGPNAGNADAWVGKYNAEGTLLWTRQLGTTAQEDTGIRISADRLGNVYLAGSTQGNLAGANAGGTDSWVGKYDPTGALLWTRQLGTTGTDNLEAVSADGLGNVYIAGRTTGTLAGANLGGIDAWVAKYDPSGTLLWTRQLGTSSSDGSWAVSADGIGNVYVAGTTHGDLAGLNGGLDAWLAKYDAGGALQWTRQFGTTGNESARALSADSLGNVYVAGSISNDAWLGKYDASGTLLWTHQFGTAAAESANGISADGLGNVYVAGDTNGSLAGAHAGGGDAFLAKYIDIVDASLPGDFDNDGAVDGADFLAWQRHVGLTSGATRAQGDANADGRVDAADLALWKSHFGAATAAAALITPPASVPEPSAWALAGPALALLLARNRGRVSHQTRIPRVSERLVHLGPPP